MGMQVVEFGYMLVVDIMFILVLFLLMVPLGIWRQAAFAVMKRNFVGYFSSPTGYVFLCLFVLLTSFAAFWPHEFFTTNLANLDQLNRYLPYIMLIFIPAITMSIWAEERRQGTDELLLTLPARDFDIVIGKYFAAVLVFTVSLLFSHISNYAVLIAMTGGQLDSGLLFSTYLGYWWMGIAMLSIGMVASFLTNNLTVGFIFGAAFNAPLAFFSDSDVILSNSTWIQRLFDWSLLQRFEPFGRGLISLPSMVYFLGIVIIGVYLSLILIGRRHWLGGRDGTSMLSHFVLRGVFLAITAIAFVLIAQHSSLNRIRADISANQISTLSPKTIEVLKTLAAETVDEDGRPLPPIKINAYVSDNLPTEYIQSKQNLVNLLREFKLLGGNRIQLNLYENIGPFSREAIDAETKFGIRPKRVSSESRGAIRQEDIIMGVAFSSGRERVVTQFIDAGTPVEYELMRSINTVIKPERKEIAIIQTDAQIVGGQAVFGGQQTIEIPRLKIVNELLKQYDLKRVTASTPISLFNLDDAGKPESRKYEVMIVVQPSKMSPTELEHLIGAIQSGQPTLIFEDPKPNIENFQYLPGTFYRKADLARGGAEGCEIQKLWDALDMNMDRIPIPPTLPNPSNPSAPPITGDQFKQVTGIAYSPFLVWQNENPYPRDQRLESDFEMVVLNQENATDLFFDGEHPATMGITQLCLQYAGYVRPKSNPSLEYRDLVVTGPAGRIEEYLKTFYPAQAQSERGNKENVYTIAAEIKGSGDAGIPADLETFQPDKKYTNVIYVADIDLLADYFVDIRNNPVRNSITYRFQNMAFVLNLVDALAGENIYQTIRNRRERHVTLKVIEDRTEEAMTNVYTTMQEFQIDFLQERTEAENEKKEKLAKIQQEINDLERQKAQGDPIDPNRINFKRQVYTTTDQLESQKISTMQKELENRLQEETREIRLQAEVDIQETQRQFKLAAVVIPPIPPLVVGLIVFTRRRLREREGISKARRLK